MSEKTDKTDVEAVKAEATAMGAKSAQARIKAIMSSDAAKANADQAEYLAYETDLTAEAAQAILAKASKVEPTADTEKKPDAEAYAEDRAKASGLAAPGSGKRPANSLTVNMRKLLGKEAA